MVRTLLTNGEGGVDVPVAVSALMAGDSALDAIEAGIRLVEDDPKITFPTVEPENLEPVYCASVDTAAQNCDRK